MILCCGEALIDMLPTAGASGRPSWSAYPGGAIFNTAMALGRLGVPAGLMTGLSTDGFGDMLRAELDAAGVDHRFSETSDRKTALAFVTLVDGKAQYSFHDIGSAHGGFRPDPAKPLPDAVSALLFGGISIAVEPCGTALEDLFQREAGSRVAMLDPNIRPAFVRDEQAYRERLDRMMRLSDIVKLSDEDLMWLFPETHALSECARRVLDRGPQIVVVTRGSEGALAVTQAGLEIALPAPKVAVVDTVGAGDTFNAGFLAKLHDLGRLDPDAVADMSAQALSEAISFGIAAAGVVVTRAGAQPPSRRELDAQFERFEPS